jgi:PAS domain S-box-containing protein
VSAAAGKTSVIGRRSGGDGLRLRPEEVAAEAASSRTTISERALVLAPLGRDASIAVAILAEAGVEGAACASLAALIGELESGAGLVVVTEEALANADLAPLSDWLQRQEEWSDLPFVLLTRHGGGLERNPAAQRHLDVLGNVTFLERPFHPTTLVSLVRSALRGRRRQYQARARVADLRASEARLTALAEASSEALFRMDPDWSGMRAFRGGGLFAAVGGEPPQRFWLLEHVPSEEREAVGRAIDEAIRTRSAFELEHQVRRPDGGVGWALTRAVPVVHERGEVAEWVGSASDVTQRRNSELGLRRRADDLQVRVAARTAERDAVWRLSRDLLAVLGTDGVFRAVNPEWRTILGFAPEEVVGRSYRDFIWPEDLAATQAAIDQASGENLTGFVNRYTHRDGSPRWISWHSSAEGDLIYAYGRDITHEKEREAELDAAQAALRQSQKMETVGQLTGGIAHDFNNLLQIVTGNLETLDRNLGDDAPPRLKRAVGNAMIGARRAATLTHRLLAFSRRQPLSPKPVNVNKLVAGMSELLHRTLGETIEIDTALADDLWLVEVDANQLENALLNLALNARDAMPHGGALRIVTANRELGAAGGPLPADVAPGRYVCVAVADTGVGIEPEVLERVFEPFFTTKEVGRGTGLGLSMVYGFVKQSGGHVKVSSELGRGATVDLYLPRLVGREEEPETAEAQAPPAAREETVLVCEDDDGVRALSVDILRELGYRVLAAPDARAALQLLERHGEAVDLLFSDVVLPGGMSGPDLAAAAHARHPRLRVLFTTGYAPDAGARMGGTALAHPIIGKPFTLAELASRVRAVLAS